MLAAILCHPFILAWGWQWICHSKGAALGLRWLLAQQYHPNLLPFCLSLETPHSVVHFVPESLYHDFSFVLFCWFLNKLGWGGFFSPYMVLTSSFLWDTGRNNWLPFYSLGRSTGSAQASPLSFKEKKISLLLMERKYKEDKQENGALSVQVGGDFPLHFSSFLSFEWHTSDMGQLLLAAEGRINTECFHTGTVSREDLLYTVTTDSGFADLQWCRSLYRCFGCKQGKTATQGLSKAEPGGDWVSVGFKYAKSTKVLSILPTSSAIPVQFGCLCLVTDGHNQVHVYLSFSFILSLPSPFTLSPSPKVSFHLEPSCLSLKLPWFFGLGGWDTGGAYPQSSCFSPKSHQRLHRLKEPRWTSVLITEPFHADFWGMHRLCCVPRALCQDGTLMLKGSDTRSEKRQNIPQKYPVGSQLHSAIKGRKCVREWHRGLGSASVQSSSILHCHCQAILNVMVYLFLLLLFPFFFWQIQEFC